MADRSDRFACIVEGTDQVHNRIAHSQPVRIADAARQDEPVEIRLVDVVHDDIGADQRAPVTLYFLRVERGEHHLGTGGKQPLPGFEQL